MSEFPGKMKMNNKIYNTKESIAKKINDFFSSIGKITRDSIINNNLDIDRVS